jgi:hypothetical protein
MDKIVGLVMIAAVVFLGVLVVTSITSEKTHVVTVEVVDGHKIIIAETCYKESISIIHHPGCECQ